MDPFATTDFEHITCGNCRSCGHCKNTGRDVCKSCDGEEHVKCYSCMGEREWTCEHCNGKSARHRCDRCAELRQRLAKEAFRLLARDRGRGSEGERRIYVQFAIESRDEGCLPELEAA